MSTVSRCLSSHYPLHYRYQIWKPSIQTCHCLLKGLARKGPRKEVTCYSTWRDHRRDRAREAHRIYPQCQYNLNHHRPWDQDTLMGHVYVSRQSLHYQIQNPLITNTIRKMSTNPSENKIKKQEKTKVEEPRDNATSEKEELITSSNKEEIAQIKMDKIIGRSVPERIVRYVFRRYVWYLNRFQTSLENEMPDTFNMFRIFSVGLKEFVKDFMDYVKVLVYLSLPGSTLRNCSFRELQLYYNMPRDMIRVFPVLLVSAIPLGQNVAFPIAYWFPRQLLCHHFWDIQQRYDFALLTLKKRLFNARPVFRMLQGALYTIQDESQQAKCKAVFYKLGSGIHPTVEEILALKPLFQDTPFHIRRIYAFHVNGLLRLHGRPVGIMRRRRLVDLARKIHYMDTAVAKEGVESLSQEQLKACLFLRGLNPANMRTEAMKEYMNTWLQVSREIDSSSYSLLLHLPILLAYNEPTNIVLIY